MLQLSFIQVVVDLVMDIDKTEVRHQVMLILYKVYKSKTSLGAQTSVEIQPSSTVQLYSASVQPNIWAKQSACAPNLDENGVARSILNLIFFLTIFDTSTVNCL